MTDLNDDDDVDLDGLDCSDEGEEIDDDEDLPDEDLQDQAQTQDLSIDKSLENSFNNKRFNNAKRNVVPNCIALPKKLNSDVIKIAVVNARSALNKIDDIGCQFSDKNIDIMLCSETWQTHEESTDELIETLEETYGVKWIGKGRLGRRGGGVYGYDNVFL